ncbi:MAG: 4Fe-4S binding protein [Chloroflexi bacterium]|nr:4Fe-4S binding protein [Chloroflexota bacterium]
MDWDVDAEKAMDRVPFFVRRMAKKKVEELARSRGSGRVTMQDVMDSRDLAMGKRANSTITEAVVTTEAHVSVAVVNELTATKPAAPIGPAEGAEPTLGGLTESQIRHIEELVEKVGGHESRFVSIKGCGGAVGCPLTLIDVTHFTTRMKEQIDASGLDGMMARKIRGPVLTHHKFKTAVSGCANCCSEPQIKDFAIVAEAKIGRGPEDCIECGLCIAACKEDAVNIDQGEPIIDEATCVRCGDCAAVCPTGTLIVEKEGLTILVGGKLGRRPQFATKLIELADEETVFRALDACIEVLEEESQEGERLGSVLDRMGIDRLRSRVIDRQRST